MAHAVAAPEPAHVVRMRDVHRTHRRGAVLVPVPRGVDLEVAAGEWVAILGKVMVSGSTTCQKSAPAAVTDVTPAERVAVRADFSAPSSGGQVKAATVIIQPMTSTGGTGT
jgi:hypothetical protein